ncbi:hypothetical protein GO986_08930 [Deinococcus sp. HMF7620]|uniref:Uncharacterized protein n=1 Tax=Deinococcus arboris TaxID=2682977 RepID=A0A7C9HRQ0_9DEIO|nr:hypothetical protein [Deinococcus arboris]MVN86887.1 hypothetical protein [Deinococcus arboris]
MIGGGLDRRTQEAVLYMHLGQKGQAGDLSDPEAYLLGHLHERLRAFRISWLGIQKGRSAAAVLDKSAFFVAELEPANIPPLEEVMDAMERKGWEFRITSRKVDGHRLYSAHAWLPSEDYITTQTCRDPFPKLALAGAWVAAERFYRLRLNADARRVPASDGAFANYKGRTD